jgi:iron-sulfur cluster assembly protein
MNSITLTPAAANQIHSQIAKQGGAVGLRVGLKPVGCSGYAYTYALADGVRDGEQRIEAHGVTLLVATEDLSYMAGACLDFVTEGLKQSFQFDNPNVGHTCGCGESVNFKAGTAQGGTT